MTSVGNPTSNPDYCETHERMFRLYVTAASSYLSERGGREERIALWGWSQGYARRYGWDPPSPDDVHLYFLPTIFCVACQEGPFDPSEASEFQCDCLYPATGGE